MKKRSLWMFIAGMLCISGGFVSCDSTDDGVDAVNTLTVKPDATIEFKASGNADVVLTVTTDAKEWDVKAPEWVTAKKEGKTLTVNVKDNTTGTARPGRLEFTAGTAEKFYVSITQAIPGAEDDNVLSVDPSTDITFKASGNTDVTLAVSTDAASWEVEAPEWVTAKKEGNNLIVNAEANTGNLRSGSLKFTAGTAAPVIINVTQSKAADPSKVAGALKDKSGETNVTMTIGKDDTSLSANVVFTLESAAAAAAEVEIFIDEAYLVEYNYLNKIDCVNFPKDLITIANGGIVSIAAGSLTSGDIAVTLNVNSESILFNTNYLIPLSVKVKSSNVTVADASMRVNYVVKKKAQKAVKNVLYYEVNDVNPLNTLEYVLEDGTMFFDAIILFAANINYDMGSDVVFLNNNPNVQALLDGSETFLQPLRKKGIKVYLGLLGNHDAAGLCQLSDWGCQQFAKEMAEAVLEYKLDGVNFDDEYSSSIISGNKWFTSPSVLAGARLCYETKKALKEIVPYETEVSIFEWGAMYASGFPASIEGQPVSQFLDFQVANYGGSSRPVHDQTMKSASGASIELNLGRGSISETSAMTIKSAGYGWVMWFSFAPVGKEIGSGTVNANLGRALPMMKAASLGLYDTPMLEPTGYYRKTGEGVYDSKRYTF